MEYSRTIVILSDVAYTSPWSRRQQIAAMSAEAGHSVLFVEPQSSPSERFNALSKGLKQKQQVESRRTLQISENLWRLSPPLLLPWSAKFSAFMKASEKALAQSIMEFFREHGWDRPVVVATRERHASALELLQPTAVIYDPSPITESDMTRTPLAKKAGALLVSTVEDKARRENQHDNIHLIPNGVYWGNFRRVLEKKMPRPPELESITGEILGYHGPLDDRIDTGLLLSVLENHPKLTLVCIGQPEKEFNSSMLDKTGRVIFLNNMDQQRLPEYLARFDAFCLPWKTTTPWIYEDPQNLYEALSAGLPVVATNLPAILQFRDLIQIAPSREEFSKELETILEGKISITAEQRSMAMRSHAWNGRLHSFWKLIEELEK